MKTAGTPQRIQLRRTAGWNLQEFSQSLNQLSAINCARPGIYGNPFIVGKHGNAECCVRLHKNLCNGIFTASVGDECWHAQRQFALKALPKIKAGALSGKNLACFCPLLAGEGLHNPCHCDNLLAIANENSKTTSPNQKPK